MFHFTRSCIRMIAFTQLHELYSWAREKKNVFFFFRIFRRFAPLYEYIYTHTHTYAHTSLATVKIMVIYRTVGQSRSQKHGENNFFANRTW